ncbi:MAG TPA: hypothetical protein PLX89_19880 [Verrucomicrobiota bacterium]|nr:hypothetical protein [Verrucomicrobiota bacterium]
MNARSLLWSAASLVSLSLLPPSWLSAGEWLRLESRYLGDRVFEYVLEFPDDDRLDKVVPTQLDTGNLAVESVLEEPDHWTIESGQLTHDPLVWEPVPYRCTFRVKSAYETYRRTTMTIVVALHFQPWALPEGFPNSDETPPRAVGYAKLMGIIPCSESEADGTPPEYVASLSASFDLKMERVLFSDNEPIGIQFRAAPGLRVSIEASDDLKEWVTVGTQISVEGLNTWKPSYPLSGVGHFFRIALKL